jgi:hypothetical protein
VEAGSNTSTVTLRVVGGDEKESLKSETIRYGRDSQGTWTQERLLWKGPAAYTKDRPVLSSERALQKILGCNCQIVIISGHEPQMGLDIKTYGLTDRQSQWDFDFASVFS